MALPNHGANAHQVYERLGIRMPETVIDYSENVNPLGPPAFVNEQWESYAAANHKISRSTWGTVFISSSKISRCIQLKM